MERIYVVLTELTVLESGNEYRAATAFKKSDHAAQLAERIVDNINGSLNVKGIVRVLDIDGVRDKPFTEELENLDSLE